MSKYRDIFSDAFGYSLGPFPKDRPDYVETLDRDEVTLNRDAVNHPPHYTSHPSGVETIEITKHMNFCLGNAIKYIMRCDLKGKPIEDLKKAIRYLECEIERRSKE
jgi:hypothetical protein